MKYLLMTILFFLAVLWPVSAAQESHFNNDVRSVSSGLTGVRKNDHTIRVLLKAQLKCLDDISAQRLSGKKSKVECLELDRMIEQTPLNVLIRYEIASPITPEDAMGIKYAIVEAAYFSHRYSASRSEER
jgi:hypothetical protein